MDLLGPGIESAIAVSHLGGTGLAHERAEEDNGVRAQVNLAVEAPLVVYIF